MSQYTPADLNEMKCTKCESNAFAQYFQIYKLSALKSPTGKDEFQVVPIYACAACGTPLLGDAEEEQKSPLAL